MEIESTAGPTLTLEEPAQVERYVVVPADNVYNAEAETTSFAFLSRLSRALDRSPASDREATVGPFKVLDRVDLNEATLVEMTPDQAAEFPHRYPSLRVAPERIFHLFRARMFSGSPNEEAAPFEGVRETVVTFVGPEGEPVPEVRVDIAFDDERRLILNDLVSDESGRIRFTVPDGNDEIAVLAATPLWGYWGSLQERLPLGDGRAGPEISLQRIADDHRDCVSTLLDWPASGTGRGVKVAVIDSGVSLPAGSAITAGINTVPGEAEDDVSDNGTGHGTHVAGIIRRIAPEAEIIAYRVCGAGSIRAREIPISKAIRHAVDQSCDIINLSLGQDNEPLAVTREIRRARSLGTVVIAATGNDWGASVAYPARSENVLAVTACGDREAAPAGAISADVSAAPPDPQQNVFHARFSNVGREVDFTAPGVGVISDVNRPRKGVMDGTSMASPVTAGLVARLLSNDARLLNSSRGQQRSDDIVRKCHETARAFGFGREYEGSGIIRA